MKSRFLMLLIVAIFLFGGCVNQTPPPRPDQKVEVKEGQKIVGFYFNALVKGGPATADQYTIGNAKKVDLLTSGLRVLGYSITQGNEQGDGAKYLVKFYQASKSGEKAYFETKDVDVTVSKEYVITDITAKQESSIEDKSGMLVYNDGKTKKNVIAVSDLPANAKPQGGKDVFGVGKKAFAVIALSPDKKFLLVATNGAHGFLGKYSLADNKLRPIDLYFEASVNRLTWSPDSKFYAIEITKSNGLADIILYTGNTDKRTELPPKDLFSDPENIRSRPFFTENNFIFSLESSKDKYLTSWYFYNMQSKNSGRSFR